MQVIDEFADSDSDLDNEVVHQFDWFWINDNEEEMGEAAEEVGPGLLANPVPAQPINLPPAGGGGWSSNGTCAEHGSSCIRSPKCWARAGTSSRTTAGWGLSVLGGVEGACTARPHSMDRIDRIQYE